MLTLRRSQERGYADHGWLKSHHSFSFADYFDPKHMGFASLRVINDDIIAPGAGFGMHGHRDMEIISYVLAGALEHKDSMGNGSVIRPGNVQRMSAGRGVLHSEYNPSQIEATRLLQIWIVPNKVGVQPTYEEKHFSRDDKLGRLCLLASPDGAEGSVTIHQDAKLYAGIFSDDAGTTLSLAEGRSAYVFVAKGRIVVNDQALEQGDALMLQQEAAVRLAAGADAEVLVFDLSANQ